MKYLIIITIILQLIISFMVPTPRKITNKSPKQTPIQTTVPLITVPSIQTTVPSIQTTVSAVTVP